MTWAQRLDRVFSIDVTTCTHRGAGRIVASIEEPAAIRAILAHFEKRGALEEARYRPAPRAPSLSRSLPRLSRRTEDENPKTTMRSDPAGLRTARCREAVRNSRGW